MVVRRTGLTFRSLATLAVLALVWGAPLVGAEEEATLQAPPAAAQTGPTAASVEVNLGAMSVAVDPQSGALRPLTREEARELARQMRQLFPPRTLKAPTVNPDGSLSAVVMPNFLRYSVARVQSDSKVALQCADSREGAIEFLTSPAAEADTHSPAAEE